MHLRPLVKILDVRYQHSQSKSTRNQRIDYFNILTLEDLPWRKYQGCEEPFLKCPLLAGLDAELLCQKSLLSSSEKGHWFPNT